MFFYLSNILKLTLSDLPFRYSFVVSFDQTRRKWKLNRNPTKINAISEKIVSKIVPILVLPNAFSTLVSRSSSD